MPADQENIGTYEKALIGFIVMEPDPKMADVRDILKDESSFAVSLRILRYDVHDVEG